MRYARPGSRPSLLRNWRGWAWQSIPRQRKSLVSKPEGVEFEGSLVDVYRSNLYLRTASRILVRLGSFYAAGFPELRRKATRLPWEEYLAADRPVSIRVTCHKSRLYHQRAVAERIAGAISDRIKSPAEVAGHEEEKGENIVPHPHRYPPLEGEDARGVSGDGLNCSEDPESSTDSMVQSQLILVRLVRDQCTISIDSSGELLHRRGYRLATAKAPLRETLAAGMLMASGWDGVSPLLDPFCGSGTIPIEAALMARRIPPGRGRRFAFMEWPAFNREAWETLLSEIPQVCQLPSPEIRASDRDAGAIRAAQANADRASVSDCINFSCRTVSSIDPPSGPGWVVTNPPYGVRTETDRDLRNLYAQFGNVLRAKCPGWRVAVLCSSVQLLHSIGLEWKRGISLMTGGIKVKLVQGTVKKVEVEAKVE